MNVTLYSYPGCQWQVWYTHIQTRNSDCIAFSVGHTNTHKSSGNIYTYGIKGLHINCRLASWFVSYAHENLSDHHRIAWFMLFVLLVLCAVNPLLTGGFPFKRSLVRWCFIKGFRIAGLAQCMRSPFVPSGSCSPKKRKFNVLLHMFVQTSCWTNSEYANENSWNLCYITVMQFVIP